MITERAESLLITLVKLTIIMLINCEAAVPFTGKESSTHLMSVKSSSSFIMCAVCC